jgi:hypothetical protein
MLDGKDSPSPLMTCSNLDAFRSLPSFEADALHHSMTWSARASSDGGMVMPRALAVLRLITNSNFVGCS